MRANIVIDDKLMAEALMEQARDLRGRITWEGYLDAMRADACCGYAPG